MKLTQTDFITLLSQSEKSIDMYLKYMDKYGKDWDEKETQAAQSTLGSLNLFSAEMLELSSHFQEISPLSDADEKSLTAYLDTIRIFTNRIIANLHDFV